jgi:hypothetical protein
MSNKDNIIFLDIDGVLNSLESVKEFGVGAMFNDMPHEMHLKWLKKIINATMAKVVISSTWRNECNARMFEYLFFALGFAIECIGTTPVLHNHPRGDEIWTWIVDRNKKAEESKDRHWIVRPVGNIVILDDDSDMGELLPYLVKTNHLFGLREEEALQAIEILKNKEFKIE